MKILGLEKMSLVDFDGLVSATLFTGGCNFKCGFCHNSPLVSDYKDLPEIPEEEIFNYLNKRLGVLDGSLDVSPDIQTKKSAKLK